MPLFHYQENGESRGGGPDLNWSRDLVGSGVDDFP